MCNEKPRGSLRRWPSIVGRKTAGDNGSLRSRCARDKVPPLEIVSKGSWRLLLLPLPIRKHRPSLSPCLHLVVTLPAATPTVEVWDQMNPVATVGPNLNRSPPAAMIPIQILIPALVPWTGTRTKFLTNPNRILGRLDRTNSVLSKAIYRRSC